MYYTAKLYFSDQFPAEELLPAPPAVLCDDIFAYTGNPEDIIRDTVRQILRIPAKIRFLTVLFPLNSANSTYAADLC